MFDKLIADGVGKCIKRKTYEVITGLKETDIDAFIFNNPSYTKIYQAGGEYYPAWGGAGDEITRLEPSPEFAVVYVLWEALHKYFRFREQEFIISLYPYMKTSPFYEIFLTVKGVQPPNLDLQDFLNLAQIFGTVEFKVDWYTSLTNDNDGRLIHESSESSVNIRIPKDELHSECIIIPEWLRKKENK